MGKTKHECCLVQFSIQTHSPLKPHEQPLLSSFWASKFPMTISFNLAYNILQLLQPGSPNCSKVFLQMSFKCNRNKLSVYSQQWPKFSVQLFLSVTKISENKNLEENFQMFSLWADNSITLRPRWSRTSWQKGSCSHHCSMDFFTLFPSFLRHCREVTPFREYSQRYISSFHASTAYNYNLKTSLNLRLIV